MLEDINKEERQFLADKCNPYLEPMLVELMEEKPKDPLQFMMNWLTENGTAINKQQQKSISRFKLENQTTPYKHIKEVDPALEYTNSPGMKKTGF